MGILKTNRIAFTIGLIPNVLVRTAKLLPTEILNETNRVNNANVKTL